MSIVKADLLATFSPDNYNKVPINSAKGLLRLLCFEPEQAVPLHKHLKGDEYFYVIEGKGRITIGTEEAEAGAGCIVKAPAGVSHKWKNGHQRLILLSVLIPLQSYNLANEVTKMELL
jgi:quercetin dioxygenase-like cupin family protein